jgi:septal ring factor EnvC (AmiA/AmiB activator)
MNITLADVALIAGILSTLLTANFFLIRQTTEIQLHQFAKDIANELQTRFARKDWADALEKRVGDLETTLEMIGKVVYWLQKKHEQNIDNPTHYNRDSTGSSR